MAARHRRRLRQKREQSASKPFDTDAFMAAVTAKADEACRGLRVVADDGTTLYQAQGYAHARDEIATGGLVLDERDRVMNAQDLEDRVRAALLDAMTPRRVGDGPLVDVAGAVIGPGYDGAKASAAFDAVVIGDEPIGTRWKDVVGATEPLTLGLMQRTLEAEAARSRHP